MGVEADALGWPYLVADSAHTPWVHQYQVNIFLEQEGEDYHPSSRHSLNLASSCYCIKSLQTYWMEKTQVPAHNGYICNTTSTPKAAWAAVKGGKRRRVTRQSIFKESHLFIYLHPECSLLSLLSFKSFPHLSSASSTDLLLLWFY